MARSRVRSLSDGPIDSAAGPGGRGRSNVRSAGRRQFGVDETSLSLRAQSRPEPSATQATAPPWAGVILRDHRIAGLLQDVGAAQVGGLDGEVGVHDAAARATWFSPGDHQVADDGLEAVLHRRRRWRGWSFMVSERSRCRSRWWPGRWRRRSVVGGHRHDVRVGHGLSGHRDDVVGVVLALDPEDLRTGIPPTMAVLLNLV